MTHQFPDPHHDEGCEKCGGFPSEPCEPPTLKQHALMDESIASAEIAGAQSVEVVASIEVDGVGVALMRTADCFRLSVSGSKEYVQEIPITTTRQQAFEEGVKAERERVKKYADSEIHFARPDKSKDKDEVWESHYHGYREAMTRFKYWLEYNNEKK